MKNRERQRLYNTQSHFTGQDAGPGEGVICVRSHMPFRVELRLKKTLEVSLVFVLCHHLYFSGPKFPPPSKL